MSVADALALGVIQGLTEFLPVSSSGHLVVAGALLGVEGGGIAFDVVVHAGTLFAVLLVYGGDLRRILVQTGKALPLLLQGRVREAWALEGFRLGLFLVAATIPTAVVGLLFQETFERLFASLFAVGVAFLVTGGVLLLADRASRRTGPTEDGTRPLSLPRALLIGLAQGAAITPGISRSGSTIGAALLVGLDRTRAAQFSFLLSVPAIAGATVLELKDGLPPGGAGLGAYATGFVASALTGFVALRLLLYLIRIERLGVFAWYLFPLGLGVIAWTLLP